MEREQDAIKAQANAWVVRQDAGPTTEEQREFEAWIASDRRHHGAYVRAKAAWLHADRLTALPGTQAPQRWRRYPTLPAGLARWAAGVATLVVAVAMVWFTQFSDGDTYVSEIGEVRNIQLADGSRLTLNTDTRTIVRMEAERREIVLKKGEALFEVAHDAARPFIVRANNVSVRAIGTAFTVRVDDSRTDVVVTEGTVEVVRDGSSGTPVVEHITASHRLMLPSGASRPDIGTVAPDTLERELAWRDGLAAFSGEPLSVAVAEINRYSRHPIVIDDPALAARPVVGIFRANNAEAFADAAAATFGAQVHHARGKIHLRVGAGRR